ncbi:uncharacterized protein KNAG_0D01710 [Huiozyma naganishii CBS 8797]|uniref:Uncharacterized protein n=1 Tax=Huiozyma naganishii (strain ATCC MYA-139 / BCRC 22969 / CBS 8797 / KCTC 17520 / NBRC 10181 / NCYC 3082 / Yp74L-3) TaxID=1071383 RepID=J7RXT9_HUIN7|nr:hypothetical protein KNAG_0D01710 [Kazachstania naganishii CBS 8797]CCK69922.1 hypothetical protein KNAG_0D01710 [Kazachstania naganishii CBS 8797]
MLNCVPTGPFPEHTHTHTPAFFSPTAALNLHNGLPSGQQHRVPGACSKNCRETAALHHCVTARARNTARSSRRPHSRMLAQHTRSTEIKGQTTAFFGVSRPYCPRSKGKVPRPDSAGARPEGCFFSLAALFSFREPASSCLTHAAPVFPGAAAPGNTGAAAPLHARCKSRWGVT